MPRLKTFALCALALFGSATLSRAADLNVGSPAPELKTGKFVKGEPVKSIEKGKFYVVEFWATWCGPCRASIPHLTELAKKNKDVTFIGVDVWEDDQDKVEPFVKEMGDKMDYHVALDTAPGQDGAMATTWMKAANQNGIPTAFVIDKEAKIAWIGHPMELDKVLPAVVAGTFDAKKLADEQKAQEEVAEKLSDAMQNEKWDDALKLLDDMEKANPAQADALVMARYHVLTQKGDLKAASAINDKVEKAIGDSSEMMNEISWGICESTATDRDLAFATKLAIKANEITKGESCAILDTLARCYYELRDKDKGNLDKAIEFQKKAVEKLDKAEEMDDSAKEDIKATLKKYESEKK